MDAATFGSSGNTGSTSDGASTTAVPPGSSSEDASTTASPGSESTDGGSTSASGSSTTGVTRTCDGWWNTAWTRRHRLEIAGTGLETALTTANVLLRLDATRIDHAAARDTGTDLRFVGAGGETIFYDIERWAPDGESVVWLRVPMIATEAEGPTVITMYYGNEDATENPAEGPNPGTTWIAYVSVHHLEDLADAANDHDAVAPGANNSPTEVDGLVAGALAFDGTNDFLTLTDENVYDFTNAMMVEVLLRVQQFGDDHEAIVTKGDFTWRLQRYYNTGMVSFSHNFSQDLIGNVDVADDEWHYLAATYDGQFKRLFVDGQEIGSSYFTGGFDQNNDPVMLGGNFTYNTLQFPENPRRLAGTLDEVRIAATPRPPDYFAWQWRALNEGVVTVGPVEICEE